MVVAVFWNIMILAIIGSYLLYRYSGSRHPELIFQTESVKSYLVAVGILVGGGLLVYFFIPQKGIYLGGLQLHSGWIVNQAASGTGFIASFWRLISFFTEVHLFGLINTCGIAALFFYLFKELDFHQKHSLKNLLQVFVAGMAMALFYMTVADGFLDLVGYVKSGSFLSNLLFHNWFLTALPELVLILLPVFFLYYFTKRVTEPLDWVIYTGLSATGFSFLFIWFQLRYPGEVIDLADILLYAAGLIIYTQISIYGYLLYRYRKDDDNWATLLFLGYGSFAYSFHLSMEEEGYSFIVFFLFVFYLMVFGVFINNAVNQMKFFRYQTFRSYTYARYQIVIGLSGLILLNFIMNGLYSGKELATEHFMYSMCYGSLLLVFFGGNVGAIDPFKGYWQPIRFSYNYTDDEGVTQSDLSAFFTENINVPTHLVGQRVKFHAPSYNTELLEFLIQDEGEIVNRVRLINSDGESDAGWFILKPDKPFQFNDNYEQKYVLIRKDNDYNSLIHDEHVKFLLRLIPKGRNPLKHKKIMHYHKMGYIILNGADYEY